MVSAQGTTGTFIDILVAKAVNSPVNTTTTDVGQGCQINTLWCSIDGCGTAGTGVSNTMYLYLIKNPGDNLSEPAAVSWGSSNEKKFIFKSWKFMIMRNQDGNAPFHWEGWVKVPRVYRRMGVDDTIRFIVENTAGVTGIVSAQFIYKWYK